MPTPFDFLSNGPGVTASAANTGGGLLGSIGNFLGGNSSFGALGPLAAGALGGLALGGSSGSDLMSYMFGGGTARSAVTPQPPAYLTSALSGLMPQAAAGIQPPQFTGGDFVAPITETTRQGLRGLGDLGRSGLSQQTQGAGNALSALASGGGVATTGARTGQLGLTDTARGDYLYGGDAFNAAVDAAMRRVMPAVGSAFGGSGRLRSGLADVALGQGVTDAFASQYAQERANQQAAQGALLNQQNIARAQQAQAAGMAPAFEALRGLPAERLLQAGQTAQNLNTAQAQAARDAALTNNQLQQGDLAARTANVATLAGATPIGNEQTTELPANPLAGLLGLAALAGGGSGAGGGTGGLGGIGGGLGDLLGGAGDFLGGLFGDGFDLTGVLDNITGPVLGGLTGGLPGLPFNVNDPVGGFDLTGNLGGGGSGAVTPPTTPPGASLPSTPAAPFNPGSLSGANVAPIANGTINGITGGVPGLSFNTATPPGAFDLTGNLGSGVSPTPGGAANVATPPGQFQMPSAPAANPPTSVSTNAPRVPQAPSTNPLTSVSVQPGSAVNTVANTAEFTGAGGGAAFSPGSLSGATVVPIADSVIGGITGGLPGVTFNAATPAGAFELTGSLGGATGTGGAGGGALSGLGASGALAAAAPALAYLAMTAGSRAERNEANSIADSWAADITEAQNAGRETVNVELGGNTYTLRVGDIGDVKTGRWFQLANGQWLGIGAEGRPTPIISNAPPDVSSTASAPSYVQNGQLVTGPTLTPWQRGLPFARPNETTAEYEARMASSAYSGGGGN